MLDYGLSVAEMAPQVKISFISFLFALALIFDAIFNVHSPGC